MMGHLLLKDKPAVVGSRFFVLGSFLIVFESPMSYQPQNEVKVGGASHKMVACISKQVCKSEISNAIGHCSQTDGSLPWPLYPPTGGLQDRSVLKKSFQDIFRLQECSPSLLSISYPKGSCDRGRLRGTSKTSLSEVSLKEQKFLTTELERQT